MTPIPHWSSRMSMKDPLLDAQHIELLEMCRSIQSDLKWRDPQNWAVRQRFDEFVFLLREHDIAETKVLHQRGQDLLHNVQSLRALALKAIEKLSHDTQAEKFDPIMTQRVLFGWIQYHFLWAGKSS